MRILRLKTDDVITPPFAVIAVTAASLGEILLLSLFPFVARAVQPFLTGRIYRAFQGSWDFSFPNCPLNSQLQRMDLGSTCA